MYTERLRRRVLRDGGHSLGPFVLQLGRSLGKGNELDAATRQEARKLAFYLFYNCNASLQRCARSGGQPMAAY